MSGISTSFTRFFFQPSELTWRAEDCNIHQCQLKVRDRRVKAGRELSLPLGTASGTAALLSANCSSFTQK